MKVEEANKIAEKSLDGLVEALEAGRSDALKRYLSAVARLYKYSLRNMLLIFSQSPDASMVAGFQTWKKLGRFVRKGERGIVIIAPIQLSKQNEQPTLSDVPEELTIFKACYVFDVAQTEGAEIMQLGKVEGDPDNHLEKLKQFVQACNIKLAYSSDLGSADGISKGGSIEIKLGLNKAEEFSVLVHELAHELIHHVPAPEGKTRTVRETEAEAVAHVVCEAIGLSTNRAAADYIQLYQGDAEILRSSLEVIQKTSSKIIAQVLAE